MATYKAIPLSNLKVAEDNPRFVTPASSQQDALLEMARIEGDDLLKLAEDILTNGLDAGTPIMAQADRSGMYKVLEGNRRVTALKGMETPILNAEAFKESQKKRLGRLKKRFELEPISAPVCAIFGGDEDPEHFIDLRHTGESGGRGLKTWIPD